MINPKHLLQLTNRLAAWSHGISLGDALLEILGEDALPQLLLLIGAKMTPTGAPPCRLFRYACEIDQDEYVLMVFEEMRAVAHGYAITEDGMWHTDEVFFPGDWLEELRLWQAEEILTLSAQAHQLKTVTKRLQETETLRALNPRR